MTYWTDTVVRRGRAQIGAFAIASLALAGCASAQNAGAENPLAPAARLLQQKTDVPPAADFVERSRASAPQGFVPVSTPRNEPEGKTLTRDQIQKEEARLDALLRQHDQIARRKPDAKPVRSAAGEPYVAPVKKKPAKCVLTCEIK